MGRVAVLLRAVNLGPHNRVSSAALKAVASDLGYERTQTLLASGNLIFDPGKERPEAISTALAQACAQKLGLATDFFVRTATELEAVMEQNPFPEAARDDPSHLVVHFLKRPPTPAAMKALRAAITGRERVEAVGAHLVMHYVDGIGESKLTHKVLEKHLGVAGTARNWNTVGKLLALARA